MKYDYGCKCGYEFIIEHGINNKPKEVMCPKCRSNETAQLFKVIPEFYTKGYGYLDKVGCRRSMNLHKLKNDDPYAHMRQPGEADELAHNLRHGNKGKRHIAVKGLKK